VRQINSDVLVMCAGKEAIQILGDKLTQITKWPHGEIMLCE